MHPSLRLAIPGDASQLAELERLANPNPWPLSRFEQLCRDSSGAEKLLVLPGATSLAGFVVYCRVLDEGSIHNIAVHPDQRRRGLGRLLAQAALAQLRAQGARRCLLEVRRSNAAARALYGELGFHMDGVRKNYYAGDGAHEDALLLSLSW